MLDKQIQEQAEKLYPYKDGTSKIYTDASRTIYIKHTNHIAQWMQKREEWISVETQTPPICGDGCLTSHKNGGVNITYFSRGYEEKDADYFLSVGYTHWMPLPSPPKD